MSSAFRLLGLIYFSMVSWSWAVDLSTVTHAGKRFIICCLDLKTETLQLLLHDDVGQPLMSFERAQQWLGEKQQKLVFGMNGGMYHGDMSPVGLCVREGRELAPLNLAKAAGNFFLKPNGIFLISDQGARVIVSEEYPALKEKVVLATQSGPLLLRNGKMHQAFKEGSKNVLHRNAVGVRSATEVIFAITEDVVNFHELATLFRDTLKCPDALFLDGTVSSLHAEALQRSDKKMDLGPMIGIIAPR